MRAVGTIGLLMTLPGVVVAQAPSTPPAAAPLRAFALPAAQESTLPNGLKLVVIENHRLPVIALSLGMPAGTKRDPAGREGLTSMLAELLSHGTTSRSTVQLGTLMEGVGGTVAAEADADFFTLSSSGLSESAATLFDVAGDLVQNAALPVADVEESRKRTLASIEGGRVDPRVQADRAFAQALFGNHPYGRRPTAMSVQGITRDDLVRQAAAWLKPTGAILVIAGDISVADARRHAERAFGAWRGAPPAAAPVAPPPASATRIRLVNRAGSQQSAIAMGNLVPTGQDPRHYALIVGSRILGGGQDSRLFRVMGPEKKWSPDARSEVARRQDLGSFMVAAEVRAQATDQALAEVGEQISRFRTEQVADSELVAARNFLAGSFPRQMETVQQVATQVLTVRLLGLGDDYLRTFRERVAAVTAADVQAAAKSHLHPDSAVIAVAGDAKSLYEKLKMMGSVEIVDVAGKPLTFDDLTPRPGPLMVDKAQFVSRRDSFVVIVQGSPLGTFVTQTVASGDSLTYHEMLDIPVARWNLDTRASFSFPSMDMRSLDQTGSMSNQPAETRLAYAGGRVKGKVQIPQPGGTPKVATIDTVVVPGVVDASALPLVVLGLPLEPQTAYTVFAFDAATGTVKPVQVTVLAMGNLGVPAGIFPVAQVQVMGPQPLILYITRESPRRIVKVERMGQPMSFELVK